VALFVLGDTSPLRKSLTGDFLREPWLFLHDRQTQWAIVMFAGLYCGLFVILQRRCARTSETFLSSPDVWLLGMVIGAASNYFSAYASTPLSSQAPTLLGCAALGKAVRFWTETGREPDGLRYRVGWILMLMTLLLMAGASFSTDPVANFHYWSQLRWSGPWENPNIFGLLMGAGVVLGTGQIFGVRKWKMADERWRKAEGSCSRSIPRGLLSAAAGGLCGFGLFQSYSRGAWCATICGISYLVWRVVQKPLAKVQSRSISWLYHNWRSLSVVALSVIILGFWQFRFTEWSPARRVFSIANPNDFSWRNRVTAWRGAVRMMADRPLLGFGWGKAESTYEKNYRPSHVESGAAIQMNDYFMLGISAGVPTLVCFLVYIGLSLRGSKSPQSPVHRPQSLNPGSGLITEEFVNVDWLKTVCRAGAIVLLVGFWFDGGLFKLATGSVFWMLLELGRVDFQRRDAETRSLALAEKQRAESREQKSETLEVVSYGGRKNWLRWVAGIFAAAALAETAVCVGTPFLAVNKGTLAIAREWLIPPKAVCDLDYLATNVFWDGVKLRTLLQHASLANYNRELINWKLDDQIYREYVLNPNLERSAGLQPGSSGATSDSNAPGQETGAPPSAFHYPPSSPYHWRRLLWEYFYPSIRKENDPQSAAEIVLKKLGERIKIVGKGPLTIPEMWGQRTADAQGFERIYVGALRSVGVPARLNDNGQTELFADGKWQSAPRPIISNLQEPN
jgi:hypothetical protein